MSDDMTPQEEMRAELEREFKDASYPVENPMGLIPALSNGAGTKFSAAGIDVTAMELATRGSGHLDFPYEDCDALLDDAIDAMEAEGFFDDD